MFLRSLQFSNAFEVLCLAFGSSVITDCFPVLSDAYFSNYHFAVSLTFGDICNTLVIFPINYKVVPLYVDLARLLNTWTGSRGKLKRLRQHIPQKLYLVGF